MTGEIQTAHPAPPLTRRNTRPPTQAQPLRISDPEPDDTYLRVAFGATLRRRRARQKGTTLQLRWQPRLSPATGLVLGAQASLSPLDPFPLHGNHPAPTPGPSSRSRKRIPVSPMRARDTAILRQACQDATAWPDHTRLLVPLDDPAAPDAEFVDRLTAILHETGLDPARLDLAFPESGLAQMDTPRQLGLATLRDQGVGIMMGGFGTAETSLTLLKHLADCGLLTGIQFDAAALSSPPAWENATPVPYDATTHAFFAAELAAMHALGLKTRITGVDHAIALTFARQIPCDEISGSAHPPAEHPSWLPAA